MKNIMKSAQLECELLSLGKEIENFIYKTELYMEIIDMKYKNRLRDKELIDETTIMMNKLLVMVNRVKDLEFQAIKNDDLEVYWKCEQRIAHIVETIGYIRNKYMF